jgi:hypothetical protein
MVLEVVLLDKRHIISIVMCVCLLFASGKTFAWQVAEFVLPSGVRVKIVESAFTAGQFKLAGCGDADSGCLINGKMPFGAFNRLPATYVKRITVSYRGRSHSLDASDMYDAWGSRPLEFKGGIRYFGGQCADTKNCGFRGLFSDGASTFVAEWRIVDGVSTRTVMTDSSDVVDLFMKQIDPPGYE